MGVCSSGIRSVAGLADVRALLPANVDGQCLQFANRFEMPPVRQSLRNSTWTEIIKRRRLNFFPFPKGWRVHFCTL
jgi:hypothetical protein